MPKSLTVNKKRMEGKVINSQDLILDSDKTIYENVSFVDSKVVFEDSFEEDKECFNQFQGCDFKGSEIDFKNAELIDCENLPEKIKATELNIKGKLSPEDALKLHNNRDTILKSNKDLDNLINLYDLTYEYEDVELRIIESEEYYLTTGKFKGLTDLYSFYKDVDDFENSYYMFDGLYEGGAYTEDQFALGYAVKNGMINISDIADEMVKVKRLGDYPDDNLKDLFYKSLETIRPARNCFPANLEDTESSFVERDVDTGYLVQVFCLDSGCDDELFEGAELFDNANTVFEDFPEIDKLPALYKEKLLTVNKLKEVSRYTENEESFSETLNKNIRSTTGEYRGLEKMNGLVKKRHSEKVYDISELSDQEKLSFALSKGLVSISEMAEEMLSHFNPELSTEEIFYLAVENIEFNDKLESVRESEIDKSKIVKLSDLNDKDLEKMDLLKFKDSESVYEDFPCREKLEVGFNNKLKMKQKKEQKNKNRSRRKLSM